MKKLILGLVLAFAANVAMAADIDGIDYSIDEGNWTAKIVSYLGSPTELNIGILDWFGRDVTVTEVGGEAFSLCDSLKTVSLPFVTSIGERAFTYCDSLETVSIPAATSIGRFAFDKCDALKLLVVKNAEMKQELENNRWVYGIGDGVNICLPPSLTREQAKQTAWGVGTVVPKCDGKTIDEADYESACLYYGLTAKQKPEDPQLVQEGEVAVKETELQAAKAETVQIADGVVSLGVTVNTNGNFTAETKDWKPVELKPENVKVENGKIVISIPVSDKSGFMILQSGDAKIPPAN